MTTEATPGNVRLNDGLGPLPERWYVVSRDGLATLCASERNAHEMAADCMRDYPRQAPYRSVMMGDVAAGRATALHDAARWVDEYVGHAMQDGYSVETVQALMAARDMLRAHAEMLATTVQVGA